jgi:peptidoglycan/xylan/chitin deacetylase (PgdA/CDA1 family)
MNEARTKATASRIAPPAALAVAVAMALSTTAAVAQPKPCPGNPNALGVVRTVEIDTTGGPGFGMDHYKAHDFLQSKEVILTFDDGPQKVHTEAILTALAAHCAKATFFSVGKMALGYPEIIRRVALEGHTVATHTWSHQDLRGKATGKAAIDEIERGVSAVRRAVGAPISSFFRFPFLKDSQETLAHLQGRNIAMFSTDIDSFDFKFRAPDQLVKTVMDKLEKRGKGILLLHDVQPVTGKAAAMLLDELKAKGYKVVHMRSKTEVKTLPEFDALIEKDVRGLPTGTEKPTASIVRTIDEPAAKAPISAAVPAKK